MSEEPVSKAKIGGWLAFILAVLGGTAVVVKKDEPPPPPPPTETAAPPPVVEPPPPPVEPPVTETREPEPPPVEYMPDELSTAGRRRPVQPSWVCDADDIARAKQYSEVPGYAYLATRCDLIHEWKKTGGHFAIWLCENGYDSPGTARTWTYNINREIRPGDKLAIRLWTEEEYGAPVGARTIRFLHKVKDWTPKEGFQLGTLVSIEPGAPGSDLAMLAVSSYGVHHAYFIERNKSLLVDHGEANAIGVLYHGVTYDVDVSPDDVQFALEISVPCYRDPLTANHLEYYTRKVKEDVADVR